MRKQYYTKKKCRLCSSKNLVSILKLKPTPPGNHFVKKKDLGKIQKKFPLEINFCKTCTHVQLKHVVRSDILFQRNYSYLSGVSKVFVSHLEQFAFKIIKRFKLKSSDLVVEIGSNDGTALSFYKKNKIKCIGVDPARKPVEIAKKRGINSICNFFSLKISNSILENHGKAKLITSHNTLAHIDDWDEIAKGVFNLLEDNGIFIFEVGYFLDVFQNNLFDTIYHEHLDYHTLYPLVKFMKKHNMYIFDVERVKSQGGSIRVYCKKNIRKTLVNASVYKLLKEERSKKINRLLYLRKFERNIINQKNKIKNLLKELFNGKKQIIGYGAPTKATTMMYFFEIDKYISYLVEDNKLKQNMFSPGLNIKVISSKNIYKINPDYIFIFAWNFSYSIIEKHRDFLKKGGNFIVPFPNLKLIKNK